MIEIALGVVFGLIIFSLLPWIVVGLCWIGLGIFMLAVLVGAALGIHTLLGIPGLIVAGLGLLAVVGQIILERSRSAAATRELLRVYLTYYRGSIYVSSWQRYLQLEDISKLTTNEAWAVRGDWSSSVGLARYYNACAACKQYMHPKLIKWLTV